MTREDRYKQFFKSTLQGIKYLVLFISIIYFLWFIRENAENPEFCNNIRENIKNKFELIFGENSNILKGKIEEYKS